MRKSVSLFACCLAAACATTSGPDHAASESATFTQPRVSLRQAEKVTLGDAVRQLGDEVGGSLVLMQGVENQVIGPFKFNRTPYKTVAQTLAEASGCVVQFCPYYYFIYPPAYEILVNVSLESRLDAAYDGLNAAMAFGADTPLFRVFALLGQALDITIVADNAIGDATCGELTLGEIPLERTIEAVLKSARIAPAAFRVESTSECIFIRAAGNIHPAELLLNPETLTPEQTARLDTHVDVVLPTPQTDPALIQIPDFPTRLREVLDALSVQLGMKVDAEPALYDFPVNPVVLNNVRVRTVIDLLIRQWLVPEFGYEVTENGIVLKQLRAEPSKTLAAEATEEAAPAEPTEPTPSEAPTHDRPSFTAPRR